MVGGNTARLWKMHVRIILVLARWLSTKDLQFRGWYSTEVAFALLTQQPGFDSRCSKEFSSELFLKKFILDVADINRQHILECGKLEYVDKTI